jgi:hypothetical protein
MRGYAGDASAVVAVWATADHRALAWHAYLWDPWFLIWGLLVVGALRMTFYTRVGAARDA